MGGGDAEVISAEEEAYFSSVDSSSRSISDPARSSIQESCSSTTTSNLRSGAPGCIRNDLDTPDSKRIRYGRDSVRVYVAKYFPGKPMPRAPPGVRNILIHTTSFGAGGALSPYVLKDEKGHLLENFWQFSKVYARVNQVCIPLSRFHPNDIVWKHPEEEHIDKDGNILPAYWAWRAKGMAAPRAVRYPNGFHGRKLCKFALWPASSKDTVFTTSPDGVPMAKLDYIEARRRIYCAEYIRLSLRSEAMEGLRSLLKTGVDLQIVEVDGPAIGRYNNIESGKSMREESPGLLMDWKTIQFLLNDPSYPFGHGFVVASMLLYGGNWLNEE